MKKNQKRAFTLSEVLITLVLMGIIAILYSVGIKLHDPTKQGFDIKAQKTLENIDQVFSLIHAKHSETFNLTDLNDSAGNFSIEDSDAAPRFAEFFREFLNIIDFPDQDSQKVKDYLASNIMNYDRTSTGLVLKDTYSNFMYSMNGTMYGFRLYQSCSADEKNSNPPLTRERKTISNVCGSIFYDINAYDGPNKLGSDQYIIPFDTLGAEIKR